MRTENRAIKVWLFIMLLLILFDLVCVTGVVVSGQSAKPAHRSKAVTCRIVSVEKELPETAVAVTEERSMMKVDCGKRGIFTKDITDGWPDEWMGLDVGDSVRGRLVRGDFYPIQVKPKP